MTQQLRDLMHRVADDVPAVQVDDDTWVRARRARRRDLVAGPALAVALVLGAVTVGVQSGWLTGPSEVAPAAPEEAGDGAVPEHVYAVPERLEGRGENDAFSHPREDVSVVTRASAGYVTTGGGAVLVSAQDGVHHRVELAGFNDRWVGVHDDGPVLAVSPDGRKIAYFWRQRVPDGGSRVPAGVRVLDLGSGKGQEYPLPGGVGVRVGSIGWSPDGGYLVYRVGVLDRVDPIGGFSTSDYRLERLDVRTGERAVAPRRIARVSGGAAVSDDGVVSVGAGTTLFTWSEVRQPAVSEQGLPVDLSGASAWADDGERVALGSIVPVDGVTVAAPWEDTVDSQGGLEQQVIRVLGWVGRDYVVAVRHPESWTESTIDLLPVRVGQERTVGVVDSGVQLDSFTVATDLMSLQRPTVEFAAPEWERDRTWWWLGGGVLALAAGAAGLVVVRRRA
jgi:hypothetical protein